MAYQLDMDKYESILDCNLISSSDMKSPFKCEIAVKLKDRNIVEVFDILRNSRPH